MEKLITNYALDDTGVTTLRMLANILTIKDTRSTGTPFNLLLTFDDEQEANRFAMELMQYIYAHSSIRHVYRCAESEMESRESFNSWRKNDRAFFIFADSDHSLEQRKSLGALIEEIPECIVCMCISDNECQRALKQDDHLFYRVFPYHIHVTSASAPVITSRFLSRLTEHSFAPSEAFVNAITEYIKVVYPKADLKDDAFIQDLLRRVINNHFGSGNESSIIEESSVPFYIREDAHLEESIPTVDPITSTEVLSTSAAGKETLASEKDNSAADMGNLPVTLPKEGHKQANTLNILLLSLSKFPYSITESTFSYNGINGGYYIYQLEPVIRMLSNQLLTKAPNSDYLDNLVMLCTGDTKKEQTITLPDNTIRKRITPLAFFKERVRDYLNPYLDDKKRFIDIDVDEESPAKSIKKVIDKLRELKSNLPSDTKINLYVDRHGGFRSLQQFLDAILSLLHDEFSIIESYDVKYDPNVKNSEIVKLDNRSIFDFVSGINEFTNYGRIDSLRKYPENKKLNDCIIKIADSIQLCSIYDFEKGLDALAVYFTTPSVKESPTFLSIFEDSIRLDYKSLLTDNRTIVDEIQWCLNKGFYQQALTLIEGAMPRELHKCGVFSYSETLRIRIEDQKEHPHKYRNKKIKEEINVFIFNNSVTSLYSDKDREQLLKSKNFKDTSSGNNLYKGGLITKADNLMKNTTFSSDKVTIDSKYCNISFKTASSNILYAFLRLHCTLKKLRNFSNHASMDSFPISLGKLKEAIIQYIEWARTLEEYALK